MIRNVLRFAFAAAAFAAITAAPLAAQAPAPADSMAFPRQVVKWFTTAQADSLYGHAGDQLKSSMESSAKVVEMMGRMAGQLGEYKSTDAEVQLEKDGTRLYIAVVTFSQAPEQGAIAIRYNPGVAVIEGMSIAPLSRVKARFPEAKLP